MNVAAAVDVPVERAFAFVRQEMGLGRAVLVSPRRAGLVRARALFAWMLRQRGVSYGRIAQGLQRERDAIPPIVRVAEELRRIDPAFQAQCKRALVLSGEAL